VPALAWPRLAGGAAQRVPLGALAQLGYASLGKLVADGVVHRGLPGVASWQAPANPLPPLNKRYPAARRYRFALTGQIGPAAADGP
jgi:hypothetical protein